MNLWCPNCNGTQFYYEKLREVNTTEPGQIIVHDQMKCKNHSCGYEFQIEWYGYIREDWVRENMDQRIQKMKRRI